MDSKRYLIPLSSLALAACGNVAQEKPNIIYVFPDQFRNQSLGFWNEEEYSGAVKWQADPVHTPNLNAFADEAAVLSRAMSNCPLSSPYRGIFLSGMYPERSGITLNCMALRPESTLNPDAVCISDVFAANGYSCGYIGKLHAETPMKNDPANPGHYVSDRDPEWDAYTPPERRHGFSYWYSYGTFDVHKDPHYWDTEGVRHDPHEYSVKHETDRAIEFLRNENGERKEGAPFFLALAYNPPHSPYESLDDCMEEDYALYRDMDYSELYVRPNADTTLSKAPSARYYFANVTGVDREFGRLLAELERLGLEKNTIVVFTSDHGETMCSQGTLDPKNSIYTESFNVPFLIRYPDRIRHRVDSTLLSAVDIMPTMLALAGLEEAHRALDGDVVRLSRAGRENDVLRVRVDQLRDLAARFLNAGHGLGTEPVLLGMAGAVRVDLVREHRVKDAWVDDRRRLRVEVVSAEVGPAQGSQHVGE